MQDTKISAPGYNATQSAHIQIRNTIENMHNMRDGQDIRKYSASARKELLLGDTIDIVAKDGKTVVGIVPTLALVVVSSTFRDYLEKHPDSTTIKISNDKIEVAAASVLLKWINVITKSAGKFGVNVPGFPMELIKVRHAAMMLGMEKYVTHFSKAYKDGLRDRKPSVDECTLLERYSLSSKDDLVIALGERLGYLRRVRKFNESDLSILTDVLNACAKLSNAVQEADARANTKRTGL